MLCFDVRIGQFRDRFNDDDLNPNAPRPFLNLAERDKYICRFPKQLFELSELRKLDDKVKKVGFLWQIVGFSGISAGRLTRTSTYQICLERPLCFSVVAQEFGKQQV